MTPVFAAILRWLFALGLLCVGVDRYNAGQAALAAAALKTTVPSYRSGDYSETHNIGLIHEREVAHVVALQTLSTGTLFLAIGGLALVVAAAPTRPATRSLD